MTVRLPFLWRLSSGRAVRLYKGLSSSQDRMLTSYIEITSGNNHTLANSLAAIKQLRYTSLQWVI